MKIGRRLVAGVILAVLVIASARQALQSPVRAGNAALEAGRQEEAAALYALASERRGTSGVPAFNLGVARYMQGRYPEAAERFGQAVDRFRSGDEAVTALYNLGGSLALSNKLDEAAEAYKQALRLDPSHDDSRYNLTVIQQSINRRQGKNRPDDDQQGSRLTSERAMRLLDGLADRPITYATGLPRPSGRKPTVDK